MRFGSTSISSTSSATASISIRGFTTFCFGAKLLQDKRAVIIEPFDLPMIQGPQESIHEFEKLDEQVELRPILDQLTARPLLDLAYGDNVKARLPEVVGGLSPALARPFKIIDGGLRNPQTQHWQKCVRIFDLLI